MVDLNPSQRVTRTLGEIESFIEREVEPLERKLAEKLGAKPGASDEGLWMLGPDGALSPPVWEAKREVMRRSAAAGFYQLQIQEEIGGGGFSRVDMFFVEEAVYRHGLGLKPSVLSWTEGPNPVMIHFNEDQRRRFVEPLVRAEKTAAFALTEPGAGSDVLGIKTRAVRHGDDWVLSGRKAYITNTQYSDLVLVTAVTEPGAGSRSLSVFVVEADRPGFRRGKTYPTIMDDGLTGELFLDDVRVPDANRIGERGQGLKLALTWINSRRLGRGGMCSGWGKFLLDRSLEYARHRRAFGAPIGNLQAIQHFLADMYVDWYGARALSIAAQWEIDRLGPYDIPLHPEAVKLMALVKLANDEAFYRIADRAVQIHGASGLMKDNPTEKLFRIARNLRIPAGTVETQRNVIARGLGLGRG
jgi:alkylation response protein AidB-like acyl-CoA dehydrogenase